ncbi:gallerimycin-like [Plodia interpunctella]|uniref:gallerimycin-like n=1 Tax=Plodia interpunctella TaxID=58824 RepID=UPI002367C633|nr:gallerimycin-like [Plodia interpunctella]
MKACLAVLVLFAVVAFGASLEENPNGSENQHVIKPRATIIAPPYPSCVFWRCTSNCRNKGFWKGGYCTLLGCQCIT